MGTEKGENRCERKKDEKREDTNTGQYQDTVLQP
jgi:hypothetical protein